MNLGIKIFPMPKKALPSNNPWSNSPQGRRKNKKPWGKRQRAYPSVNCHIGMNGGT
jgi:hypothetical protein